MEQQRNKKQNMSRKPLVYHDFNLRFASYNEAEGTFKVWVEGETLGGTMRPDDAFICSYEPEAFWNDSSTGSGGLLGDLERRRLKKEGMFALGKMLADLALPPGLVRDLFQQSLSALQIGEGLRVRLHIDPAALTHLPWEFMALSQVSGEPQATDFLALRREISIVRTDTVETFMQPLPERPVARVVGVLSSPDGQMELDVSKDREAVEGAVQALCQATGQNLIEVIWAKRPATREALMQALAGGADIFHFAGHGVFIDSEGQVVLEKGDNTSDFYRGEQLAQLLHNAGVRLTVLGACETGRRNGRNIWGSIAGALTRQKIPAVVANQFKIRDGDAILLAANIYPLILAGGTVDEAVYEARQAIYQHNGLEDRDWGVPVLYLHDASGILFPTPETDTAEHSSHSPFLRVSDTFNKVRGHVVDVKIGVVTQGHIQINNKVDSVEKEGTFTTFEADQFGR
ncbi:hypothetical protein KSF_038580 [Reticulibacter mediterranei]|uniref:CHAT domain-containing protein n=1 Tax=Reticulibacter mediterranei TaxID=2778369 RepID=A0A8J3IN88_9CHLR|nr:CHAT domain-containing protein [Reticulibacter mediterranei]GHO93810.1 hypothetical protein KSF_038580 [Reticulibacter mediterranei]